MTQTANPWGTDMAVTINSDGALDLEPTMRDVSGIQVLVQSLVMRQTTATGTFLAVPDDCFDCRQWISKEMTSAQVNQIAGMAQNELLKDERVQTAYVTGSFNLASASLVLTELIRSSLGPFTLTLTLTQSSVSYIVTHQGGQ